MNKIIIDMPLEEKDMQEQGLGEVLDLKSIIKAIWVEVLRLNKNAFSSDDNFFLLGGDSLVLAQIKSRLEENLHIKLNLSDLFLLTSINKMATFCQDKLKESSYVASAAQTGLWFVDQLHDANKSLYNLGLEIELKGGVDIPKLQLILDTILQRHGSLRSNFHFDWKTKQLKVIEAKYSRLVCPVVPIQREELKLKIAKFTQKEFDLKNDLLIRACLFQVNPIHYVLVFSTHHIVTDGWSGGVFLRELNLFYQQEDSQKPLVSLKSQYRDYCIWQKQQESKGVWTQQLTYWCKHLQHMPEPAEFSLMKLDAKQMNFYCDVKEFVVEGKVFKAAKHLVFKESVSLFMINLAIFKLALSLSSGANDITLGIPVANRPQSNWENIIGYFVNLIAHRDKINWQGSFHEFLQIIKETTLSAFQNQDAPFQYLVKELRSIEPHSQNPFFSSLFAYQNSPSQQLHFSDLEVKVQNSQNLLCHYGLKFEVLEQNEHLSFKLEYSCELYEELVIEQLIETFQKMFEAVSKHPDTSLQNLKEYLVNSSHCEGSTATTITNV